MKKEKYYHQAGFTLTESIIVIFISVAILTSVYALYALNQKAYIQGELAAEINQNGRVVIERMSREIRQARSIVTVLPEDRVNPSSEILFHDGHLSLASEVSNLQGVGQNSATLSATSSNVNDYYKYMFLKITSGSGSGQIKKIVSFNNTTKVAKIEGTWDVLPDVDSQYKIDTNYYYIHYYRDSNSIVWREVLAYYFSGDSNTFVAWNSIPPIGQTLENQTLEESRIIGEYVSSLEFWGANVINIYLTLQKQQKSIEFTTSIFGRNL